MILFHRINYKVMEEKNLIDPIEETGAPAPGRVKVFYPEYWAKRKNRLNPNLVKELEETAAREPEVTDDHGSYKPGTFLFKNTVVTVRRESGMWSCHIFSEHPIGLPLIKEVRYKFLPDNCCMVQLFGTREESNELKGVVLYELPNATPEDVEEVVE